MTCKAPPRSHEQRLEALSEANRIRVYRAARKRDLAAGRVSWSAVLDDPDFATAKVVDVALALPGFGRVKVAKVLKIAAVAPSMTIGGLTRRQRVDLTAALVEQAPPSVLRPPTMPAAGEVDYVLD